MCCMVECENEDSYKNKEKHKKIMSDLKVKIIYK